MRVLVLDGDTPVAWCFVNGNEPYFRFVERECAGRYDWNAKPQPTFKVKTIDIQCDNALFDKSRSKIYEIWKLVGGNIKNLNDTDGHLLSTQESKQLKKQLRRAGYYE